MRFAGIGCVAAAAVVIWAGPACADELRTVSTVPKAKPPAAGVTLPATMPPAKPQPDAMSSLPSLTPPSDVQGAWVSDASVRPAQSSAPASRVYSGAGPTTSAYPPAELPNQPGYGAPNAGPLVEDPSAYGQSYNGYSGPMPGGPVSSGETPLEGAGDGGPAGVAGWRRLLYLGEDGAGLYNQTMTCQQNYARVEYLSMWAKGNPVPPLLTTSTPGTAQTAAGVLGQSSTSILFGNDKLDTGMRSGGRLTLGHWLGEGQFNAIEGHYMALGTASTNYSMSQSFGTNPGAAILARPFFDVNPDTPGGRASSSVLAYPNFFVAPLNSSFPLNGTFNLKSTSNVQSAGLLLKHLLWIDFDSGWRVDLLGGYRYFRVNDSVFMSDSSAIVGTPYVFTATDQFGANTVFNGGELGASGQFYWGRLSLETIGKVALGGVQEKVAIQGYSTFLGTPVPGGLLAQPTNIGVYRRNQFAVLPEVQLNLRYDLSSHWRLTAGYNFMYLNRVQHSGSAIDTTVNSSGVDGGTLTGAARPTFHWADTGFFVQGVTAGAEFRW